ncbi:MAG: 4Fe-4S dicluster domain-containing protein [Betaproteobacteria bacterium]
MKTISIRSWRRVVAWLQATLVLGLPFVRVHGESALRFDVPSLKLYFFGSVIWISEAYFFLLVFLLFFIGIMLFTVLYGRIWCGWMCPQTVLSDFSRQIERIVSWFSGHRLLQMAVSQVFLLLASIAVAVSLIWYFVSPYDMAADIVGRSLGPWTFWAWVFFTVLIYLNLAFVRQRFCGSVCPYARFQSAFFDEKSLTIAFDRSRADECHGCEACVRNCPSGIDIRDGLQVECINCAECIDACARQMKKMGKIPLVRYFRGTPGDNVRKGPRPRVITLSVTFAFTAMLFAYQIYIRVPLDFWIFRDEAQSYHQAGKDDGMINVYSLVVENRSLAFEMFRLSIAGIKDAQLFVARNPFAIPPNTTLRTKVYVFVKRKDLTDRVTQLRFILENVASREIRVEQEATFVYPDRTEKGWEI